MFANILFDLILLGLFAAGIVIGIKNGFIDTVAKPVKFFAAIALAISLASVVGSAIIEPIIGPAISNKLSDALVEKYADITAETASESLPTLIKFAASLCGVDIAGVASTADGISVIEAIVASVTDPVVQIVATITGFVIVYFVAKILLGILIAFINTVLNRGVTGTVNKILGAVFTGLLAFAACWALTAVLEFLLNIPLIANMRWVENFSGGFIYRFFKSFTPLDLLLSF